MGRRKSKIKLNGEAIKKYLRSRGISLPRLAADLDINYSHLYRLVKGEKNVGIMCFMNLQKYFDSKGLNYKDYIVDLEEKGNG